VSSDDVLDVMAMNHIDRLELPLDAEVITRYKNEVFDKEPFEQHLNFRRLTLSKEVLGDSFKTFMDGDHSFNCPEAPLARVAIFCELIRLCVPECGSVLHLKATIGSKDEVPITEEALKLWEILVPRPRNYVYKPTNMSRLLQSLVKTANHLFGSDYWDKPESKKKRIGGDRPRMTTYTVNQKWRDRQTELFRYSKFYTENSERDT